MTTVDLITALFYEVDEQLHGLLPISELAMAEGICYTRGPQE